MRNLDWEYESCIDCGRGFRVLWSVKDELWQKVRGVPNDGGGSLCVGCFVERAEKKGIHITREDFEIFKFFNPY